MFLALPPTSASNQKEPSRLMSDLDKLEVILINEEIFLGLDEVYNLAFK